jgi:Leucine-rich repeat (LRR) protein
VLQLLDQVEVLSLSVNNITSLEDVQNCRNLQELFVRKNNIQDLSEILWLKPLRKLSSLMLSENPCSDGNGLYRHTVLRTLPQLRKLDNQDVTPEEMAQVRGRAYRYLKSTEDLVDPNDGNHV